jgi:hypothetical protein
MPSRSIISLHALLLWSATLLSPFAVQAQDEDPAQRGRNMSERAETRGLAEDFTGVTRDGTVEPGLFSIGSTGVSTEPVRLAAEAFLAS